MNSAPSYPTTSLADLLPAVRYMDPQLLASRLDDVRLPLGWWHATSLTEIERVIGAEALTHRVAQALRALWPQVVLGDLLPVLRLLDGPAADAAVKTVARAAGEAGVTVAEGDAVLAALFGGLLDRLHGRPTGPVEPVGRSMREAVAVIGRWMPADAPAAVREALAVLRREHGERDRGTEPDASSSDRHQPEGSEFATAAYGLSVVPTGPVEEAPVGSEEAASADAALPAQLMDAPLAAFEQLVAGWDEREAVIARSRIFADEPERIGVLVDQFGVGRARIYQVEQGVRASIGAWLATAPEGQAFAAHLAAVAELLGAVGRVHEIRDVHEDHAGEVDGLGVPFAGVVARLLPERSVEDEWIVRGDADTLAAEVRDVLHAACSEAPLRWDEATALAGRYGVRTEVLGEWAGRIGRFRVLDGHLVHWGRSVGDRSAVVLALHGEPLSMEEIHQRLADGSALNSMRNQIWADERFVRLDRDLYGLRQWGGEEYLGIKEMIVREIERGGGEVEIATMVEGLTTRFDVSAASVRTNLAAPRFARTRRGWLGLAPSEQAGKAAYTPRYSIADTRRCFLGGDGRWWYRMEVTGEHLRGSGSPVPAGWAADLGSSPSADAEPVVLRHATGDVRFHWRTQPMLGSVRAVVDSVGAALGEQVFLNVTDGVLSALRLPADEPGTTPEQRAVRLTGWTAAVTPETAVDVIAQRTGMAAVTDAEELAARLRERGDRDIVDLLAQSGDGVESAAA